MYVKFNVSLVVLFLNSKQENDFQSNTYYHNKKRLRDFSV